MALVVEDGTGLSTAESYVSVSNCGAYATKIGANFPSGESGETTRCEQALRRATQWIDATYGARFKSYRTNPPDQALEWPRYDVWHDGRREYLDSDALPTEIVSAACEAAIREYAKPGSLVPDTSVSGVIKRYQAGSVSIEYERSGASPSLFPKIDGLLSPLMNRSALVGRAVRG